MSVATSGSTSQRGAFIERVSRGLDRAGVEYVLLHGYDDGDGATDSDVDLAVGQGSLATLDAIVRSGAFGRMLQRLDYDIPWCRYYVVESQEPSRRYRQLDVACDPWGIGKYGRAVAVALSLPDRSSGVSRPNPAAETYYLAVKRAVKRPGHPESHADLRAAFDRNPSASGDLLGDELGHEGVALARALEHGRTDLSDELRAVAQCVARQRRTRGRLMRRAVFSSSRIARRLTHPTGLVVCLAGPDGAGKSTLAGGLQAGGLGAFRRSVRLHSRPGLLPPPAQLLGRPVSDGTDPHGRAPSGVLGSAARVTYLWLDFLLGWPTRVAGPRRRSTLVVLERGWLDLSVDPRRYRLTGVSPVARLLGRLLPNPDLTFALDAPAAQTIARKPELAPAEAERQRQAWQELAAEPSRRVSLLDASRPADAVLDHALGLIDGRLASRQPDYAAASVALRCAGTPDPRGTPFALVRLAGRPRWLLRAKAPGPLQQGLYRPANSRQHVVGTCLDAAQRLGRTLGGAVRLDPDSGVAPVIAEALGVESVTIAGAVLARDGGTRVVLRVVRHGTTLAYAKIDETAEPLERERRVLAELARIGPTTFTAPHVLGTVEWDGLTVLLLEPLPSVNSGERRLGGPEVAALAELWDMKGELANVLGTTRGWGPAHGDFAPWNTGRRRHGLVALWDWEQAREAPPLEDYFHWHTQQLVLLRASTVMGLVNRALNPDNELKELCTRLVISPDEAPFLLRSYLERSAASSAAAGAGARTRMQALELLGQSTT